MLLDVGKFEEFKQEVLENRNEGVICVALIKDKSGRSTILYNHAIPDLESHLTLLYNYMQGAGILDHFCNAVAEIERGGDGGPISS